jgi:hypothetical protein
MKPGVYGAASATVFCTANTEDAAEVGRPNPSRRSSKPKSLQSSMIATKITAKALPLATLSLHAPTLATPLHRAPKISLPLSPLVTRGKARTRRRWNKRTTAVGGFHPIGSDFFGPICGCGHGSITLGDIYQIYIYMYVYMLPLLATSSDGEPTKQVTNVQIYIRSS